MTSSFQPTQSRFIQSLNLHAESYIHPVSKAIHIHLDAPNNSENAFMVAFRTIPNDSTGVAHILEHTVLCGSQKYPVRDPFFMMTRRSLNSFMNAMTSSDWTAYPFASNNKKDFNNLLQVYLDSVFFPHLHPLDFAQEGHRLEFDEPNNSNSKLLFKGVVFNEMKGAMSSPMSYLWQKTCIHLYPDSPYQHNSGGEPDNIPELTHQQLVAFHQRYYRPDNTIFMTFGSIPAQEHQQQFEHLILNGYDYKLNSYIGEKVTVPQAQRLSNPVNVIEPFPVSSSTEEQQGSHIIIGWLLGDSTQLNHVIEAQLLSAVLLNDSASPLLKLLETSELGKSPSPLCGAETSQRDICFLCGLEGIDPINAEKIEQDILTCIQQVANEGIPLEQVEACLHQIELEQREITGGSTPYGLQLLLTCLPSSIHHAEPFDLLDLDPILQSLKQKIKNPDYIKSLCQKLLVSNAHRVRLSFVADAHITQQQMQQELDKLKGMQQNMDKRQQQHIIEQTQALQQRQTIVDDPELLPKVSRLDISENIDWCTPTHSQQQSSCYSVASNGIVYQQMIAPLPQLSIEQLKILPLLSYLIPELGAGKHSYLDIQQQQSARTGGISAFYQINPLPHSNQQLKGYFVMSGKALADNQHALADLLQHTFEQVRFDEQDRIASLITQAIAQNDNVISSKGHLYASIAASQYFSTKAWLNEQLTGLSAIKKKKYLGANIKSSNAELTLLCQQLADTYQLIKTQANQQLFIGDQHAVEQWIKRSTLTSQKPNSTHMDFSDLAQQIPTTLPDAIFWDIGTQVSYCSQAFSTVSIGHPDVPALMIAAHILNNHYLHTSIREQGGAYGGGCSQDSHNGVFKFYSYRDPRSLGTFNDFDLSIQWMLKEKIEQPLIEEAILGIFKELDKPDSPAGLAKKCFYAELFERCLEQQQQIRQKLMEVTSMQIQTVVARYLHQQSSYRSILGGETAFSELSQHPDHFQHLQY